MTPVGGLVVFLILWWVVLFTMLPIGVRGQWEEGGHVTGTDPGAPIQPRLWRKALWTTAVTALLWLALDAALVMRWIPVDLFLPAPR